MLRVAADVTESGRLFHTRAAATEKARSMTVVRRVGGTTRTSVVADRSRRRASRLESSCSSLARYCGADSDTQVEKACTQSAAPSSTNAVVQEVATHGGVSGKKTPGVPQHSEQTATG